MPIAAILNSLPANISLLDPHGVIVQGQKIVISHGMLDADSNVGSNYLDMCRSGRGDQSEDRELLFHGVQAVLQGELPFFGFEYPYLMAQQRQWFYMTVVPISQKRRGGAVVMHLNITERKEAELKLQRIVRLHAVSAAISEAILRVKHRHELFQEVCRIAVERGSLRMAFVVQRNLDSGIAEPIAFHGEAIEYLKDWTVLSENDYLYASTVPAVFETGKPAICNDIKARPGAVPSTDLALKYGFRSCAAFPIQLDSQKIGAIALMAHDPDFFQTGEIDLLEGVASGISLALKAIISEEQKLRAERLRTALYEISDASDQAQSLRDLYESVHQIVGRVMAAKNFYIALSDDPEGLLTYPYFIDEKLADHAPVTAGRGLTAYVLRTGSSLLCSHAMEEKLAEKGEVVSGVPSAVWLGVPLSLGEKIIGVMAVQDYENPAAYGDTELEMLEFVSTQVARAIDKKRSEEHRKLQARVMEATANAIVITDRDGSISWVNSAFTNLSGYSAAEAILQGPKILRSEKQTDGQYVEMWNTIFQGTPWRGELVHRKKGGELYTEQASITPVRDESGEVMHFIAIKQDVTRERELEDQFRKAQKMEAVGRLAAGIAHDFNNHLAVILGYTEMLEERLSGDSVSQEKLAQVHNATLRAATLTKQLLAFSRQQVLEPVVLDLNVSVHELEKMLRSLIGTNIDVTVARFDDLARIKADPAQIDQILMNLAINARDAMPNGGSLTIETANVDLDAEYAAQHSGCTPGPYVMLAISDTGTGMDAATQARIFEPFFTTKEPGKGTGLGLSTVYGIVKQSGGSIWVCSEVGHGTSFKVYFPAIEELVDPKPPKPTIERHQAQGETILLVEDTGPILEVLRELLQSVGYTVHAFGSPKEALRSAEQHLWTPVLLITDLIMPGISGRELADRITTLYPEIKVLYMSGYTDDTILRLGIQEPARRFIQKPFNRTELMEKVRTILNSKPNAMASRSE